MRSGLNLVTPIFAARWRVDFQTEIVGRAAGTAPPAFFSLGMSMAAVVNSMASSRRQPPAAAGELLKIQNGSRKLKSRVGTENEKLKAHFCDTMKLHKTSFK